MRRFGKVFIVCGEQYGPFKELVFAIARELDVFVSHRHISMKLALWAASLHEKVRVPLGLESPLHDDQ